MPRKQILHYNPNLKHLSRKLRNNSTLSEALLWQHIKNRQIEGYKFLRQKPIDDYIVDFFCRELMLAVEVDGVSHEYKMESDLDRQRRLESLGIKTIRFMDIDIKKNMDGVLKLLRQCIAEIEE